MWKQPLPCLKKSGLTLVEVVAGLAILSTLLVSVLMAFGKNAEQIRKAKVRLQAIEVANMLLADWTTGEGNMPAAGDEERVGGDSLLRWRMVASSSEVPLHFDASVIRLEIFAPTSPRKTLASVELLSSGRSIRLEEDR